MRVELRCNSDNCRLNGSIVMTDICMNDVVYISSFCPACGGSIYKFMGVKNAGKNNQTRNTERRRNIGSKSGDDRGNVS